MLHYPMQERASFWSGTRNEIGFMWVKGFSPSKERRTVFIVLELDRGLDVDVFNENEGRGLVHVFEEVEETFLLVIIPGFSPS